MNLKLRSLSLGIVILIGVILLSYTATRAYKLSFTHDESLSFLAIHRMSGFENANTHILNSGLMKVFSLLFGNSELSLRSPALIAHLMFMSFSFLILERLRDHFFIICGFLFLNANPFLLDFF